MIESTDLTPQQLENLLTYDGLVTSSTWNAETFARHGLTVPIALQGVHTALYRPARSRPARQAPTDPFRIFSGGKFEYRKGHDLVIDAFRTFRQRFPHIPATLVIAWHNVWPQTVGPLHHTGYLTSLPAFDPVTERFDFAAWLATQGLSRSDVEDLGYLPPDQLAPIVQNCDAGLFLSRAEGANNQPLGECLSAGVPCVVSPSTGHRDYASDDPLLLTLTQTTPTRFAPLPYRGLSGWIESDPFEAALALEAIATAPTLRADRMAFHAQWNWDTRAAHLLPLLRDVGA